MGELQHLGLAALEGLSRDPRSPVEGCHNGSAYTARIAIPDYGACIARYFGRCLDELDLDLPFRHFGLSIEFECATEIAVHDEERRLDPGLRGLLDRFGPLSLRNAYLSDRSPGQRNVFQSLSFHIDRGGIQDDKISLFWRDPFDPLHYKPRSSSTLVLANVAAYLQALKEGESEHEFKKHYYLFENEDIDPLIDDVLIEIDWRADDGVGEISVVDNQTVLHASYYSHPHYKGYPIAVRYLF